MATGYLAAATGCATLIASIFHQPAPARGLTVLLDDPIYISARSVVRSPAKTVIKPRPVYKWRLPPLTHDQWIVAASAWGECRGYGQACMTATINVMHNRAVRFGTSTAIESLKHAQLSCWGDQNRVAMWGIGRWIDPKSPDGVAWILARGRAIEESHGRLRDVTHSALWYHTKAVHPAWDKAMRVVARIGPHLYFARKEARS